MYTYKKIRVLLAGAEKLYNKGKITPEMYLNIVENIEEYFLSVQKKIQEESVKEILDSYIATLD